MQSNSKLCDINNEDNLLDIASGFLYLATESLIPKSINKRCLTDSKVLQQVDKKFIPIIAGGALAIIDQVRYLHFLKFLKHYPCLGVLFFFNYCSVGF